MIVFLRLVATPAAEEHANYISKAASLSVLSRQVGCQSATGTTDHYEFNSDAALLSTHLVHFCFIRDVSHTSEQTNEDYVDAAAGAVIPSSVQVRIIPDAVAVTTPVVPFVLSIVFAVADIIECAQLFLVVLSSLASPGGRRFCSCRTYKRIWFWSNFISLRVLSSDQTTAYSYAQIKWTAAGSLQSTCTYVQL